VKWVRNKEKKKFIDWEKTPTGKSGTPKMGPIPLAASEKRKKKRDNREEQKTIEWILLNSTTYEMW